MKKLGEIVVKRLEAQSDEAKELGMLKLAQSIDGIVINNNYQLDLSNFSEEKLQDEIYNAMWRTAATLISFHDVQNPDAIEIEKVANYLTKYILAEMRTSLQVKPIGPYEPSLPGEIKE